jgi:integrase
VSPCDAQLCEQAQLSGVSPHRLRHTVATFLVSRGDLLIAQQRLGHRDPSTTLRNYAHAIPLADGAASDVLDEALGTSLGTQGACAVPVSKQ